MNFHAERVMRDRQAVAREARHGAGAGRSMVIGLLLSILAGGAANAQGDVAGFAVVAPRAVPVTSPSAQRPFMAGERLTYAVRIGSMAGGRGEMSVSGPVDLRGTAVLVLRSEMKVGVGPINGVGRTQSWLDAERMTALRFVKNERRVLSRHRDSVEVFPDVRRWSGGDGTSGATPSGAPLDELSFIYFIRTLPLTADTTFEVSRHFDATRNPIGLRILGGERVTTPAGDFQTIVVEMRVKDPRQYRGEGVIRIHLTDDACRIPVRIESTMPDVGKTVLTLESASRPDGRCSALDR